MLRLLSDRGMNRGDYIFEMMGERVGMRSLVWGNEIKL